LSHIVAERFNANDDLVLSGSKALEQCLQGASAELSDTINIMTNHTAKGILEGFKGEV
jgi:hypothetical protein